jgi:hypothetical protein
MFLECKHCSAIVDAKVIATYDDNDEEEPPGRWFFCHCPRCTMPMLAVTIDDGYGFEEASASRLYPTVERRQLGIGVPTNIQNAFKEAVICFNAGANTASAIMCRKTLEGLCEAHGAKTGNLAHRLTKLQKEGIIESRLFEWAEALRISGNEAAHGVGSQISRQDCEDILGFTEALAEYVFTYRDRFEKFKRRGASRGLNTSTKSAESGSEPAV